MMEYGDYHYDICALIYHTNPGHASIPSTQSPPPHLLSPSPTFRSQYKWGENKIYQGVQILRYHIRFLPTHNQSRPTFPTYTYTNHQQGISHLVSYSLGNRVGNRDGKDGDIQTILLVNHIKKHHKFNIIIKILSQFYRNPLIYLYNNCNKNVT